MRVEFLPPLILKSSSLIKIHHCNLKWSECGYKKTATPLSILDIGTSSLTTEHHTWQQTLYSATNIHPSCLPKLYRASIAVLRSRAPNPHALRAARNSETYALIEQSRSSQGRLGGLQRFLMSVAFLTAAA